MSGIVRYLDRRFYPDSRDYWDSELFRALVQRHVGPRSWLLDFGAGRGSLAFLDFRATGRRVAGVDVGRDVLSNPLVDEAKTIEGDGRIPYPDGTFDVVLAHNVLEHVPNPAVAFRDIHRVLKSGGVFLGKTPNRRHYVPLIARATPHRFHVWINQRRGRDADDTFPTVYRVNTPAALTRIARETGFVIEEIDLVEGRPEYLRLNAVFYLVGLMYERAVNHTSLLRPLRAVMLFTLRKPDHRTHGDSAAL